MVEPSDGREFVKEGVIGTGVKVDEQRQVGVCLFQKIVLTVVTGNSVGLDLDFAPVGQCGPEVDAKVEALVLSESDAEPVA